MTAYPELDRPVMVAAHGRDDATRDALALGLRLARLRAAPLVLLGVWASPLGPGAGPADHVGRTALEEVVQDLAGELPEDVEAHVAVCGAGSVPAGLHRMADGHPDGVLVIGPSRLGRGTRALRGDIALAMVHDAPCAVLVAPEGYRDATPAADIVLGWDGTAEARLALDSAVALAGETGGTLVVVTVIETPAAETRLLDSSVLPAWRAEMREFAEQRAAAAVAAIGGRVPTRTLLPEGLAEHELARAGEHAGFIVVGSRGRGPLRRLVLGSISAGVLQRTEVPVLILPRGAGDRAPVAA